MLINNLDHLESIAPTEKIMGGTLGDETFSFSLLDGALTLKQGESVLFEKSIALPDQGGFFVRNVVVVAGNSAGQTVDSVVQVGYAPSVYPFMAHASNFWRSISPFELF